MGSETRQPFGPAGSRATPTAPPSKGGYAPAAALPLNTDTGLLFRELRRCLKLPLPELARRLETRIDVITALEAGDVRSLPSWPETVRVVSAYTMLAKIDPRPVLHVLNDKISADNLLRATERTGRPSPRGFGLSTRLSALWAGQNARTPTLMAWVSHFIPPLPRSGKSALRWAAAVLVLAAILLLTVIPSKLQQASATGASGAVTRMFGGLKGMLGAGPMVRDGFTWIEVSDPRSRKGDKLRAAKR